MMTRIFWVMIGVYGLFLSGCASLQSVSLTTVPKERTHLVQAEESKFIFLGLTFDNDFVDDVNRKLSRKCKNGKIEGILTKAYTTNYFLFIFMSATVEAKGYCIRGAS